jgi:lysozyme family protein
MADYKIAITKALNSEGFRIGIKSGYVNDKTDRGGETAGGVSRVFHPKAAVWAIVDAAKKKPNFPESLAKNSAYFDALYSFYRTEFWNVIAGDKIADQSVANMLVSSAILEGTGKAVHRAESILDVALTSKMSAEAINELNSLA